MSQLRLTRRWGILPRTTTTRLAVGADARRARWRGRSRRRAESSREGAGAEPGAKSFRWVGARRHRTVTRVVRTADDREARSPVSTNRRGGRGGSRSREMSEASREAPPLLAPFVDSRALGSRRARSPGRSPRSTLDTLRSIGLAEAGRRRLRAYGAALPLRTTCFAPARGPAIVVSNHPGLFDCLALFAAIGRDDLSTLAAERPLLAALPNFSRRSAFTIPEGRATACFRAPRCRPPPRLRRRAASLPGRRNRAWIRRLDRARRIAARRLAARGSSCLLALAARRALEAPSRSLRSCLGRDLEAGARGGRGRSPGRRGATDAIVLLFQLTFPGFTDVDLTVRFGPPRDPANPDAPAVLRDDLETDGLRFERARPGRACPSGNAAAAFLG